MDNRSWIGEAVRLAGDNVHDGGEPFRRERHVPRLGRMAGNDEGAWTYDRKEAWRIFEGM